MTEPNDGADPGPSLDPDAGPERALEELEALEDEVVRLKRVVRDAEGDTDIDTDTDTDTDALRSRFEDAATRLQNALALANGGHGSIDTRSGGRITPLEPDPGSIALEDIAHGLSNLSRFTGQGKDFYSVARHAVHVSREVEARGGSLAAQRWGLLHDASEAYLSDVPAPVKRTLPGYTCAEKRLHEAVRETFDLEVSAADEQLVDAADAAV
ncbi:HD domain-containing protein, partial [Halobiforma nitratireducens]